MRSAGVPAVLAKFLMDPGQHELQHFPAVEILGVLWSSRATPSFRPPLSARAVLSDALTSAVFQLQVRRSPGPRCVFSVPCALDSSREVPLRFRVRGGRGLDESVYGGAPPRPAKRI